MPNKPDKFGIKFWLLAEVNSKYLCNGFPYLGSDLSKPLPKGFLQGEAVTKDLLAPYLNKGYCCTTNNFFTTKPLAEYFLSFGTTLIGTVKKNKRWLPSIVHSKMELNKSVFYEDNGYMMVFVQCKPDKSVDVLSTAHDEAKITAGASNTKKKSNLIQAYNATKCGVDSVDQMTRSYSVKYQSRRWPVQCWSNVVNIAGINAWVLHREARGLSTHICKRYDYHESLVGDILDLVKSSESAADQATPACVLSSLSTNVPNVVGYNLTHLRVFLLLQRLTHRLLLHLIHL